ncbi:MAG: hypothetical protein SVZ03_07655 [Spirochaetota bacterium]|nr:hypothetical protein [Spirochaetota bacterium]
MPFLKKKSFIPLFCMLFIIEINESRLFANNINNMKELLPEIITIQTAGYIGFVAIGIGHSYYSNFWETGLFYGYVPESIGGCDIHTIAWKNSFYPFEYAPLEKITVSPIYFGITMLCALDKNLYWHSATDAPQWEGYYFPTGIHFTFNIGFKILKESSSPNTYHSLFIEISSLDIYIKSYLYDDNEYLGLRDIATLAIGYKLILNILN